MPWLVSRTWGRGEFYNINVELTTVEGMYLGGYINLNPTLLTFW